MMKYWRQMIKNWYIRRGCRHKDYFQMCNFKAILIHVNHQNINNMGTIMIQTALILSSIKQDKQCNDVDAWIPDLISIQQFIDNNSEKDIYKQYYYKLHIINTTAIP